MKMIVRPNSCRLDPAEKFKLRKAPRPSQFRDADYEHKFDAHTLWYDGFWLPSRDVALLVGPPLHDLQPTSIFTGLAGMPREALNFVVDELDRCSRVWIDMEHSKGGEVSVESAEFEHLYPLGESLTSSFEAKRVLLTKNQNNELQWIQDWVEFHVRTQGTDAVLLYDNQSTRYGLDELLDTVGSVAGIQTAVVVDWDFPYGPGGGAYNWWDSDFAQYGIMEHARWRFLVEAKSVLQLDIDELVISPGSESVYSVCEMSDKGCVLFPGQWVYSCDEEKTGLVRHTEHLFQRLGDPSCPFKWVAVPAAIPLPAQWRVHDMGGLNTKELVHQELCYRHCFGINNSWKWQRPHRVPFDALQYRLDAALQDAFSKKF